MFKKIDIQKFGLFSDYNWNSEIGSDSDKDSFKKINIIYGRNYSRKTTLSRIFRSFENKKLDYKYKDAQFILTADDGVYGESTLEYPQNVRVYNKDFVKDNLGFLIDETDGKIDSFALVGEDDVEKKKEIEKLRFELGKEDENGLRFNFQKKKNEYELNKRLIKQEQDSLYSQLKNLANSVIKVDEKYFRRNNSKKDYITTDLEKEIPIILNADKSFILTEKEKTERVNSLIELEKPTINPVFFKLQDLASDYKDTKDIVEKNISGDDRIREFVENGVLLKWLEEGVKIHKEKHHKCQFCKQDIVPERWEALQTLFNKDYDNLKERIDKKILQLKEKKTYFDNYITEQGVTKDLFYNENIERYASILNSWNLGVDKYTTNINLLLEVLQKRKVNILTSFSPNFDIKKNDFSSDLLDAAKAINELIESNNNKTKSLIEDKEKIRQELRYSLINDFLIQIDYSKIIDKIKKDTEKNEKVAENLLALEKVISKKEKLIQDKQKEIGKETNAALMVNKYLKDFFGHDSLYLDVENRHVSDNEIEKGFKIKRGNEDAFNLSEGECSLIAFCYFMAKIEDELHASNAKENLIVYIDDPISSLDNNHIFFIFGLIDSVFLSKVPSDKEEFSGDNSFLEYPKYELSINQLFISTHNLTFLKYLHRLRKFKQEKKGISNTAFFLIEKRKKDNSFTSVICEMPEYMQEHITEYNYLFEELCKIVQNNDTYYNDTYSTLYNIGNNMRKFLESFLAFKYAGQESPLLFLPHFFENNKSSELNRAPNELSHLVIWLEKGTSLLEFPEAKRLASTILKMLKEEDEKHFRSLCYKAKGKEWNIYYNLV